MRSGIVKEQISLIKGLGFEAGNTLGMAVRKVYGNGGKFLLRISPGKFSNPTFVLS